MRLCLKHPWLGVYGLECLNELIKDLPNRISPSFYREGKFNRYLSKFTVANKSRAWVDARFMSFHLRPRLQNRMEASAASACIIAFRLVEIGLRYWPHQFGVWFYKWSKSINRFYLHMSCKGVLKYFVFFFNFLDDWGRFLTIGKDFWMNWFHTFLNLFYVLSNGHLIFV